MRKSNISAHNILLRTAGVLLILTLLSACMLCGMYARYTAAGSHSDSARVAQFGIIELKEHKAVESNEVGVKYKLNMDEVVEKNSYSISPGDVIKKDPFVRLKNIGEVRCELYLQVTQSEDFPTDKVKYEIDPQWEPVDGRDNVYKYTQTIEPGSEDMDINILKDKKLTIGDNYNPKDSFNLKFSAWLKQAK